MGSYLNIQHFKTVTSDERNEVESLGGRKTES